MLTRRCSILRLGTTLAWSALTNAPVALSPPASQGIGPGWTFLAGFAGAASMYLYWFRTERIQKAIASFHGSKKDQNIVPTEKGWKVLVPEGQLLVWDLGISILLGGVAAIVITTNGTWKEAFFIGCTWNSVFARIAKSGEKGKI